MAGLQYASWLTLKPTQSGVAGTCKKSISCRTGNQQVHPDLKGRGVDQKPLATTEAVREATGSQLLWSQAITDRIRHTADRSFRHITSLHSKAQHSLLAVAAILKHLSKITR